MILQKEKLDGCVQDVWDIMIALEKEYGTICANSGKRTPETNNTPTTKGAKNSAHLTGEGVDVSSPNVHPFKIANFILVNFGTKIKGLAVNVFEGFVHFDVMDRGVKGIISWTYDRKGNAIN